MSQVVVFEGLDGVGKSTLMRSVAMALMKCGFSVQTLAFPSKKWMTQERLKQLYAQSPINWGKVAKCMFDDMLAHQDIIAKSTADIFLIDRYFYSSFGYQCGYGDYPRIAMIDDLVVPYNLVKPNLVLWCRCHRLDAYDRIFYRDGANAPDLKFIDLEVWEAINREYTIAFASKSVIHGTELGIIDTTDSAFALRDALTKINDNNEKKTPLSA